MIRDFIRLSLLCAIAFAAEADPAHLRQDVEYLASDALEGRMTGSEGARMAADYLIGELERIGAVPAPGTDDFRLAFEFFAGASDGGSMLTLGDREWTGTDVFSALSFSDSGEFEGEIVFAGYGLVTPEDSETPYDSYVGLDVTDKIVLVLNYYPESADKDLRAELARYSLPRYKARHAREKGAKAILVVTGPNSPNAGKTISMGSDTAAAGSSILAASMNQEIADALFANAPKTLAQAQTDLDGGNPHVGGFALPDVRVQLSIEVIHEQRTGYNVVGMLEGGDPDAAPILVGAHYDHLGHGDGGNSLAKKDEQGGIHHGADDNASGCAAVLEIGRQLALVERSHPVLLAFWSGEEIGLVGSEAYVDVEDVAAASHYAYLNFDMVGRSQENALTLQATGSSSVWPQLAERINVRIGFDLTMTEDPYLPTDASALYRAGVPTLNFFTGAHEDYHRPSDTADRINYEDLDRIAEFGSEVVKALMSLEERPDYVEISPQRKESGDRDTLRAYTGTIPDYTTQVEGLLLSGVVAGGPADLAGLQEGDIIVEFNGQTIANIYDYTYALDTVKIGIETKVVVMRGDERVELTLTPSTR